MMNAKKTMDREEDFFVRAKLDFDGTIVEDVPCKVFLPLKTTEKPWVILKPDLNTFNKIKYFWKGTLEAYVIGFDDSIQGKISASEIYFTNATNTYWGKDIADAAIYCEVENLEVINYFSDLNGNADSILNLWISPNPLVTPSMIFETSFDGNVNCEVVKENKFLIGGRSYVFKKHFRNLTDDNGEFRQWSFLVAEVFVEQEVARTDLIVDHILGDMDDFLLLASFASETKTVCLGWESWGGNFRARFFRGNISFPLGDKERKNKFETLVDISNFDAFIVSAQESFSMYENKLSLRSALYSSLACKNKTIEGNILTAFSGLETLLTEFRIKQDLIYIMDPEKFSRLKKSLKRHIKAEREYGLDSEARSRIYSKMDELNRVSLAEVYSKFLDYYKVEAGDLWPLFGGAGFIGLSDIRNRIIHGDPFPVNIMRSLITAQIHLSALLDRSLLAVLGWSASKSNAGPGAFQNQKLSMDYKLDDIQVVTNYIRQ